nr:MAG TPA: hypothetical protein [Caudoviricetes sp.]
MLYSKHKPCYTVLVVTKVYIVNNRRHSKSRQLYYRYSAI